MFFSWIFFYQLSTNIPFYPGNTESLKSLHLHNTRVSSVHTILRRKNFALIQKHGNDANRVGDFDINERRVLKQTLKKQVGRA
jgi:hypothetical protein